MIHPGEKEGAPAGAVNGAVLDQLFRDARSFPHRLGQPGGDDLLRQLYELMKWGPTSANGGPARILCPAMTKITFQRLRAGNH